MPPSIEVGELGVMCGTSFHVGRRELASVLPLTCSSGLAAVLSRVGLGPSADVF